MNRFKKILEWLKEYDFTYPWIDFNVTPVESGNVTVNSVSTEREVLKYIDGTRLVDLTFAIDLICDYDKGGSETNLNAMQEFEDLSNWIEEQNKLQNFPEITGTVEEIVALQLVPTLVVSQDMKTAKYQGQFKIRYTEE